MTTEDVFARYEKCDSHLRTEIRSRRNASTTANLAFAIVLHRDVAILEHQLKLLFRPNHAFCLHVDAKGRYLYDVRTERGEGGSDHADKVGEVAWI